MATYNGANAEALAGMYDDPALVEMLESGDWTTWRGGYVHRHGAKLQITGPHGRWVPVTPRGARLGRGYYKRPSAAAKLLADSGYLNPPPARGEIR